MPPTRKRRLVDTRSETAESPSSGILVIKRHKLIAGSQLGMCRDLYEILRSETLDDGSLLCEPFIRVPRRKADPAYYSKITTPMDLVTIQQKLKSEDYIDVEQMAEDVQLIVNNAKLYYDSNSSEYQLAETLWDLFCEAKSRLIAEVLGDETSSQVAGTGDDDDDGEDSRMSSVTDDSCRLATPVEAAAEGLKVPVLKLKVAAGGYTEGAAVIGSDGDRVLPPPVSNECSSDVDAASESQSLSTNHGRLSSCSEADDNSTCEASMGLRERRYAYRDFITPKQTRKKLQDNDASKDKSAQQQQLSQTREAADDENESVFEQLFASVVSATDNGRVLSEPFKVLPSRAKYADYYQVIREPMDLRTIAQKIQSNSYATLDDMCKDLILVTSNARYFNKPNSLIYKDAVALRKIINTRKHELEQPNRPLPQTPARTPRIRTRCSAVNTATSSQSLLATIAALRGESDEEDSVKVKTEGADDAESELGTTGSRAGTADRDSDAEGSQSSEECGDMWSLFFAVKDYKSNLGLRLAEPFLRLPSKRIYPDYYQEIKKPISLMKIQKKLKKESYNDVDELIDDLNLVFENAKQYNIEESKIYQDAVKLQTIMNIKRQELQQRNKETSWEVGSSRSRQTTPDATSNTADDGSQKKKRSRSISSDEALKKRLMLIFKFINDYQFDGRRLIDIFVTLPSRKDYPDYYKVISEPIDMTTIENKIKNDKYLNQQSLVGDLELMFKNARHYNEESSVIYKDAETLERLLHSRVRMLPPLDDSSPTFAKSLPRSGSRPKIKSTSSLSVRLQELYNTVRDYTDARGRVLSTPYMKLPPKNEYPDYYEIIKKPIDMQKVSGRMTANQYHSVEDMVADFVLMFDNACKYNEPESLIYKDALTLQRVCLSKKSELVANDSNGSEVPDVPSLVQELMLSLFVATFSHTDEEGRCLSDSLQELPASLPVDDADGNESKKSVQVSPNFDQIRRNIDKGRYKRFDRFQDDMFDVFEYARKSSSFDSQVYEDSVELQLFFIQQRDDLCRRGEVLLTPALSYTYQQLVRELDNVRREHASKELKEEEERKKHAPGGKLGVAGCDDSYEYNGQVYHVGDFVYVEQRDRDSSVAPHIVCIERFHKGEDGEQFLYGNWFFRPNETFHLATRKFLQKEVFKGDLYDSIPFHKVIGKCFVMFVKDYFKSKPEGFADDDVYVCESRYSARCKSSKKIKIWQMPKNDSVRLVPRDQVLTPVRVVSMFADKANVTNSIPERVFDMHTEVLDKRREIVVLENSSVPTDDHCTYYEQYRSPSGCWVKLGDSVYLKSVNDDHSPLIMRVDRLWTTKSGEALIRGPYFVTPLQVDHIPTRLFYKKEVFRSSREDMVPLSSVISRCAVLSYKEYCTCRFTEIPENDVYVCESKYVDSDKVIKKFNKPFKRVSLSIAVCDDEIYFFKKPVVPHKELSPLLPKALDTSIADEESMDCPSSIDQSFNDTSSYQGESAIDVTPVANRRRKPPKASNKVRQISGYIVYAAEVRKDIQTEYPGYNFGEISRVVGLKWKALPKETKDRYEERAKSIAADHASKKSNEEAIAISLYPASPESRSMSPTHSMAQHSGMNATFGSPPSSTNGPQMFMQQQCMPPPYPPGTPFQGIAPNGVPYNLQNVRYPNAYPAGVPQPVKPPPPPMFVSVPPRTQRLVHSEAYLRYIEGMTAGNRSVGGWEKSLYAKPPDNPSVTNGASDKLPIHWLGNRPEQQENAVGALWALRDLMMKDALTVSRTLDFSEL